MSKIKLYEGKYLTFCKEDTFEWVERNNCKGVVVIAAITENQEIILIEQYRHSLGKNVIELPAGLVGDENTDESFEEAAKRELLEETGYRANEVTYSANGPISSGIGNEIIHFYVSKKISKVSDGGGVGDENIKVLPVPLNELNKNLAEFERSGKLIDPKIYVGLHFALNDLF